VPLLYNDPEHWRKRAEDSRALPRMMSDPVGRELLAQVAHGGVPIGTEAT
jgi:hypothetical protein